MTKEEKQKAKEFIKSFTDGISPTGIPDYSEDEVVNILLAYAHQSAPPPLSENRQELFNLLVHEHDLILVETELDEIIRVANQPTPKTAGSERIKELETLINSPEINDFLKGVKLESAHQTERHNIKLEENKYPHDYALVLDKLKGKQALSIWGKDIEKYKHHLITMAAVCFNTHRQVAKKGTAINNWFNPSPPNN